MKSKKRIALALATCMIVTSLSACGGKEMSSESVKSNSPIPASKAFAQKGIWFQAGNKNDPPAKDTIINRIFEFDGKGNVTSYSPGVSKTLHLGDLRDLSDEEILEYAKESDKTFYETKLQENIESGNSYRDYFSNSSSLAAYEALMTKWEQLEYKEPEAQPVTLKVKTDGSGNQTAEEMLCYTALELVVGSGCFFGNQVIEMDAVEKYPPRFSKKKAEVNLSPSTGAFTVYDMQFMGMGNLYQRVKEGHPGFVLDSPDTKGVKVD